METSYSTSAMELNDVFDNPQISDEQLMKLCQLTDMTPESDKERLLIRLDADVVAWFKGRAHAAGTTNFCQVINDALRAYASNFENQRMK